MLKLNGKNVYPLADANYNIQGTMTVTPPVPELTTNPNVRIECVGSILAKNEKAMAKDLEELIKKYYL